MKYLAKSGLDLKVYMNLQADYMASQNNLLGRGSLDTPAGYLSRFSCILTFDIVAYVLTI